MASAKSRNTAASVRQRLLNHSTAVKADPNVILIWYAIERLLYRLSLSRFSDRFVLKGAMLFRLWGGPEFRATKDLDLLGFIRHEIASLREAFTEICHQPVDDDGLVFDAKTMRVSEIREHQEYGGLRISLDAKLGTALIRLQIDVGFGDAVTPAATVESFPSLLEQPRPRIRVYSRETVIAEKYEVMVSRGMTNSLMKDYYDLWFLPQRFEFEGPPLVDAIRATFNRRATAIPTRVPPGLTPAFASDAAHMRQWAAFVSRFATGAPESLATVIRAVSAFVRPPSDVAASTAPFEGRWISGEWRGVWWQVPRHATGPR